MGCLQKQQTRHNGRAGGREWLALSVRVSRVCENGFGLRDRSVCTLTPVRCVSRAALGRVREDFEEPEQDLVMLGLALEALSELRGDC
jgi:hypothetical protein